MVKIVDPVELGTMAAMGELFWQLVETQIRAEQYVTEILPNILTEQEREQLVITVECVE